MFQVTHAEWVAVLHKSFQMEAVTIIDDMFSDFFPQLLGLGMVQYGGQQGQTPRTTANEESFKFTPQNRSVPGH